MKTLQEWKRNPNIKSIDYKKFIHDTFGQTGFNEKKAKKEFKVIPFTQALTRIGLEVEVENMGNYEPELLAYWVVDKDGSLRNNGCEFKSLLPLSNEAQVTSSLSELEFLLKKYSKHDFSWRTSIQGHFDLSQFTCENFANFLLIYLAVEPLLFKVFSESRRNSVYCIPLFESCLTSNKKDRKSLSEIFKAASKEKDDINWGNILNEMWEKEIKYSAINFSRLADLNTVEFRHLGGTDSIERIRDWLSTVLSILSHSFKTEYKVLEKEIPLLNTNSHYFNFLESVFKEHHKLLYFQGYEQFIAEGVRNCKEVLSLLQKQDILKMTPKGAISQHFNTIVEKRKKRLQRTF